MNRKVPQHPEDLVVGWGDAQWLKYLLHEGLSLDLQDKCGSRAVACDCNPRSPTARQEDKTEDSGSSWAS